LLPLIGGAAALLVAGLSSPARAQSSTSDRPAETTTTTKTRETNLPESSLRKVTVRVQSVDPAKHTVILEAHVSPEAEVQSNGQPIKIDQLKAGDEIRASFDPQTGDVVKVEKIKVGSGAK
jgi:hypothetical protein